jgi:ribosomal protein L3 glutamine methyltransferase
MSGGEGHSAGQATGPGLEDLVLALAARFRAASLHYGHGTDNAEDEAWYLALATLKLPFDRDWRAHPVTPAERQAIEAMAERRIRERLPVAYLFGEAWFCGLPFEVDRHTLIPRSPVSELIEAGFHPWIDPERVQRVADVGTGCGCIAIATALCMPGVRVWATDVSAEALAVAARNVARHGVEDQVRLLEGDLLAPLPAGERLDVIVANLPYVPGAELDALPAEYRHEPRLALAGGADGLELVDRLLGQCRERLAAGGVLVCEVGDGQERFEARYPRLPVTWVEFENGGDGVFVLEAAALARQPATGRA